MRIILAILLALSSTTVLADFTARFSGGVVSVGDSAGTVTRKAGKPDRIVQLQNGYGAAVGERWEYYLHDKQINIVFSGGKIVDITEIRG